MKDFILMFTNKSAIAVTLFLVLVTYISTVQINPIDNKLVDVDGTTVVINK